MNSRLLRCAAWGACAAIPSSLSAWAESPTLAPTPAATATGEHAAEVDPAAIAALVMSLNDDRFDTREAAQQRLLALNAQALAAVGDAAVHGSLESATRAVGILVQWSESDDTALSLGALEHLAALTNRPVESAMAQNRLAEVRELAAMNTISEFGGRVEYDRPSATFVGPTASLRIVIGPKWTGGTEGLKHIVHIRHATTVSLYSAPITGDEAVSQLATTPQLMRVEIFGTKISKAAVAKLEETVQLVDVRGGARLGVSMAQLMPAQIDEVQPGTAAEKAGLLSGDVITEIDGVAVPDFNVLTKEIGMRQPGDKITLKVLRMGALGQPQPTPIDVVVEFSRWGDEQSVNPAAGNPLTTPMGSPADMFLKQQ